MRVRCCQREGVGSLRSWQTMKEAYAVSTHCTASVSSSLIRSVASGPPVGPRFGGGLTLYAWSAGES